MKNDATWVTTAEGTTRVTDSERLIQKQAPLFKWAQKTFATAETGKPARGRGGERPKTRETRARR
jgi:hypothetical protein